MSERFSRPYRTAPADAVDARPWMRYDAGADDWTELGAELPGWDPTVDVKVRRLCVVDADAIRRSCRLVDGDTFILAATAWSRDAGVRVCLFRSPPIVGNEYPVEIEGVLRGREIAGEVELRTEVVVAAPVQSTDIFAPPGPGCVLWGHELRTEVEGAGSQFPVESGDFSEMPWIQGRNAPWHIELEHDASPETPVLRAVRLYINSAHPVMREYHKHPHATDFVRFDVARTLLVAVLPRQDFLENAEYFDNRSLGGVVRRLAESAFPGWTLRELADEIRTHPATFETRLRSALELLHG